MDEKELLVKHILGILTEQERLQLEQWAKETPAHAAYLEKLKNRHNYSRLYSRYRQSHSELRLKRLSSMRRILLRAACWVLPLLLAWGAYRAFSSAESQRDIKPGTSKAILYLDPSTKVELGNSKEFAWIRLDRWEIASEEQGTLNYRHPSSCGIRQWNTLETPKGGEYRVVLEDGTRIHLNSLSTLSYPVSFGDGRRTVKLSGEAYFEVVKDSSRPFVVEVNGLEVKQYGTKFSISARSPQTATIALEEGSVGITPPGQDERMLARGEVAVWQASSARLEVSAPGSTEAYTAWHRSRFVFDNKPLGEIMETLSLWYDMDIVFESKALSGLRFTGSVGRYEDIHILLDAIEATAAVKFRINGRSIKVTNQ